MPVGCIPIFSRERSARIRGPDSGLGGVVKQNVSKSSMSLFSIIIRKDSALTSGSVGSNSSSSSSISTRTSVSFNPQVEEMLFDKHEAPSHIRSLTPTKSRCPGFRPSVQRASVSSQPSHPASRRRVERRHLISL